MSLKEIRVLLLVVFLFVWPTTISAQERTLVVAGFLSNNIVEFNLETGESNELISLPGLNPRGIAVNSDGEIFAGLRGGSKNIIKLIDDGNGNYSYQDFTPNFFARFGPGMFQFHSNGNLFVAGDDSATLFEFDGQTGNIVDAFAAPNTGSILGMVIDGDDLYTAEYFKHSIQKYDLSTPAYTGGTFVADSTNMDRPLGLAFDPAGILTVANDRRAELAQYDSNGNYLGDLYSMSSVGQGSARNIIFDDMTDSYFVTSGNSIYQISSSGDLLNTYSSGALTGAYGLAIVSAVPEPSSSLVLFGVSTLLLCRRQRR